MATNRFVIAESARKVVISLNPKAGAQSGRPVVQHLAAQLSATGFEPEIHSDVDELVKRAEELRERGELRCVVAAGGDGTVALLVNRTTPDTPIAVLPLGTENLLAKHMAIGTTPEDVCALIAGGYAARFDAARADQRLFLLMLGCGFDAEVVRRLHGGRTGHIHHLSYARPIVDAILTYDYPELNLRCEAVDAAGEIHTEEISARWAFVVNFPRYAGGLQIAPQAIGNDGFLDVCTFRDGSFWNGLRYLSGVVMGQHRQWDDCVTARVKRLCIDSDAEVPYQLDGDPGGVLPVEIEVLPERVCLISRPPSLEQPLAD